VRLEGRLATTELSHGAHHGRYADRVGELIRCQGCGALVPDEHGPTHRYILSAPGCWRVYGELQGRYGASAITWRTQKLAADAYAVQHPGVEGPQSSQSVVVHLIALCLVLEHDQTPEAAVDAMRQRIATMKGRFPWLDPPASMGPITVTDVANAPALAPAVEDWAASAWQAWAPHHDHVRSLLP
jgi:hypothetical protein